MFTAAFLTAAQAPDTANVQGQAPVNFSKYQTKVQQRRQSRRQLLVIILFVGLAVSRVPATSRGNGPGVRPEDRAAKQKKQNDGSKFCVSE